MSEPTKVNIYIEQRPGHYVGEIGITITCKPSEKWRAELLASMFESIEGWAWNAQKEQPATPHPTEAARESQPTSELLHAGWQELILARNGARDAAQTTGWRKSKQTRHWGQLKAERLEAVIDLVERYLGMFGKTLDLSLNATPPVVSAQPQEGKPRSIWIHVSFHGRLSSDWTPKKICDSCVEFREVLPAIPSEQSREGSKKDQLDTIKAAFPEGYEPIEVDQSPK